MVSWQVPYLAKGCRPNFNNGLGADSNSGLILALGVYLSPTRIPFQSCVRWSYICSGLLLIVSWWVPFLTKCCRPDFNNGLGADSNSGHILTPGVYLSPTQIMAPPEAISILCQMEHTSVMVSYLWFPGRCHTGQGLQA